MSWWIVPGLVIQGFAVGLLCYRLRGTIVTHTGAIFVVVAVVYHGLNEVSLGFFPHRDIFRRLVSPNYVGEFVLLVSLALLILTVAYLATIGSSAYVQPLPEQAVQRTAVQKVFDWRVMLLAAVPLIAVTLAGNGYYAGPSAGALPAPFWVGVSLQFLLPAIVLASLGIIVQFGHRWVIPILIVQSGLVALLGQRFEVLVTAVLLLYVLARLGIPWKRAHLAIVVVSFLVFALILTSARAAEGRFATNSGGSARLDFLMAGIANIGAGATWNLVASDLGYRLDGNSFGAMEIQALERGAHPLGLVPLENDLLLAVPSFVNSSKDQSAVEMRSEKVYAENHLGLPVPYIAPGVREDILPTQLGVTIGYFGAVGMLVIALLIGTALGLADRWLLRVVSPARLLVGIGLLSCVLFYDRSWETYPGVFRGIVVLLPVVLLIQWLVVPGSLPKLERWRNLP